MAFIRKIVSKNKRRFTEDGFDLDLSYITPRIVAMGFPADNVEKLYRNRMEDVVRFLEQRHSNRYRVYNLCHDRFYPLSMFHHRVKCIPFVDHQPPLFEQIREFCEDVEAWLAQRSDNVAIVHCKAGKGRTGMMICAYLNYSGQCSTPLDALRLYAQQRTVDRHGVTIPSQIRYIQYFNQILNQSRPSRQLLDLPQDRVRLVLRCIELENVNAMTSNDLFVRHPAESGGGTPTNCSAYFKVRKGLLDRRRYKSLTFNTHSTSLRLDLRAGCNSSNDACSSADSEQQHDIGLRQQQSNGVLLLADDVELVFYIARAFRNPLSERVFTIFFNTNFHCPNVAAREGFRPRLQVSQPPVCMAPSGRPNSTGVGPSGDSLVKQQQASKPAERCRNPTAEAALSTAKVSSSEHRVTFTCEELDFKKRKVFPMRKPHPENNFKVHLTFECLICGSYLPPAAEPACRTQQSYEPSIPSTNSSVSDTEELIATTIPPPPTDRDNLSSSQTASVASLSLVDNTSPPVVHQDTAGGLQCSSSPKISNRPESPDCDNASANVGTYVNYCRNQYVT